MEEEGKGRIGLGESQKEETEGKAIVEPKVESKVEPKVEPRVKEKVAQEEKTEDYILFPELDIEGYSIKPWTLGKLRRINPHLEGIFKSLEEKDIQLTMDTIGDHLKDIYFAAIPQIIAILAISLEKTQDDLEEVTIPQAIKLIYAVFKQNEESIKNVSNLLQLANVGQELPMEMRERM